MVMKKEISKDTQEHTKEDVAFVTRMFYKDAIVNNGGELKWENLERMIDMMKIMEIKRLLMEKNQKSKKTRLNNKYYKHK